MGELGGFLKIERRNIEYRDPTERVQDLREFLVDRLADYKIPREWAFIEALPRNPTGKILKRVLREQANRDMSHAR